jgi:hypothetical protein
MANCKILYNNLFHNYSVLTVTSEDADYPDENLISLNPRKYWKAGTTATQYITLDMGSGYAIPVKGAFLNRTNLSSGDTKDFEASADNFVSTAQTQAMTLATRTLNYLNKKSVFCSGLAWSAYRYLRFKLAISGGYPEGSTPFIARDEIEFTVNYKWNYMAGNEVRNTLIQAGQGMQFVEKEYEKFRASMTLEGIADTQKKEMDEKLRFSPYVIFMPYGISSEIYHGVLTIGEPVHVFENYWNVDLGFEELPFDGV